jgi:hypothetical protein
MANLATLSSFWPTDWVIITAVMILVALESFRAGTTRAAVLTLTLPIALYMYEALEKAYLISPLIEKITLPYGKAAVFGVLFVGIFFFVSRIFSSFDVGSGAVPAVFSSVSSVVVFLLVWVQVPALQEVWKFGSSLDTAFGDPYRFFWALGALGLLAFARS